MEQTKGLTGNKGEWSEFYAFCYLLKNGFLKASDEKLNAIMQDFTPVLDIIRYDEPYERQYHITEDAVQIIKDGEVVETIEKTEFQQAIDTLLVKFNLKGSSICIPELEPFMEKAKVVKLKADPKHKEDITIRFLNVRSNTTPVAGFSIKSYVGGDPTLLNASRATNFRYRVTDCNDDLMEKINSIKTRSKLIDRMHALADAGCKLEFVGCVNKQFDRNLRLLDGSICQILAEMLYKSYGGDQLNRLSEIVCMLEMEDPLGQGIEDYYGFKVKKFLVAVALGLTPTADWRGEEAANGGYIVVKDDGDVVCFFFYDRQEFENYLLNNTKFERPDTNRYDFVNIAKEGSEYYLNLNLQIRFTNPKKKSKRLPMAGQMTLF